MTGEVLDDAIYTRNLTVEEKFNISIKEEAIDIGSIQAQLRKVILAGDDLYDAAYCPAFSGTPIGSLITENLFVDLNTVPTFNFDNEWWNQTVLREALIGKSNKLYYASCDINIMDLQVVSSVFFNQDMMINLGLDLPYDTVKAGKWTFDEFARYIKAAANLNSAESYAWDINGTAVYGLTSYEDVATSLLEGSLERFIKNDADGNPYFAVENDRFYQVMDKIASILQVQGDYLYANDIATGNHCEPIFKSGRALFVINELKAADVFKEMEETFGILPMPKFDEAQQNYSNHMIYQVPLLVVPMTNAETDFTGAVLDALAYISYKDVTPVFFDVSVSQKRLRNEESIDMLHIIKNSGSFDVGTAYGWTSAFYDSIRSVLGQGKDYDTASQIEKYKSQINESIIKTMEFFEI
jgi:hypothetical protein